MKQIEKDKLCYFCLGCVKQENQDYVPVNRCNGFIQGIANWKELWLKELRKCKK